jgi:hypothetical protein
VLLGLLGEGYSAGKIMFDSRMPQIKGGSVSVVVVWMCMVLELGLTESHTFVWVVILAGGGGYTIPGR